MPKIKIDFSAVNPKLKVLLTHSEENYEEGKSKEYNYYDYEIKRENKKKEIHGGETVAIQNIESDKYVTVVVRIETFGYEAGRLGSGEFHENNVGVMIDYIKVLELKYKANHEYMCLPCKWNGAGVPVDYCLKDMGEKDELKKQ